jgi:hypothetical protein
VRRHHFAVIARSLGSLTFSTHAERDARRCSGSQADTAHAHAHPDEPRSGHSARSTQAYPAPGRRSSRLSGIDREHTSCPCVNNGGTVRVLTRRLGNTPCACCSLGPTSSGTRQLSATGERGGRCGRAGPMAAASLHVVEGWLSGIRCRARSSGAVRRARRSGLPARQLPARDVGLLWGSSTGRLGIVDRQGASTASERDSVSSMGSSVGAWAQEGSGSHSRRWASSCR